MARNKLTELQRQFVGEYITDFNACAALSRAYDALGRKKPNNSTLRSMASENLTKPNIQAAIEIATAERVNRTQIGQDWVVERLVENVNRSMQKVPVLDKEGNETGEWIYQGNVANQALALLGKHTGGFGDRPDGEQVHNIKVTISRAEDKCQRQPELIST